MTLKPFSMNPEALKDPAVHLTNAAVQKQTDEYKDKERREFQVQREERREP